MVTTSPLSASSGFARVASCFSFVGKAPKGGRHRVRGVRNARRAVKPFQSGDFRPDSGRSLGHHLRRASPVPAVRRDVHYLPLAALAPTRTFTLDNELRVFASRSRCKNSVGLNAVGAEGSATAHGNFSRDRALERRRRTGGRLWASPWSPLRAWKLRGRGQWTSFRADRAGVWRPGPNGCAAWPRHAWTWRSYRATELHVMVLGPTSGRAGGRTLEGLCGSRDRPVDRPTFSGWPMDQRRPRRSGREVASSAGREEAADERGQRLCAWRDARGRSSGPCGSRAAARAGGSGA